MRKFLKPWTTNKIYVSFAIFLACIFLFISNTKVVMAFPKKQFININSTIVEHLRISVPSKDRDAWLIAERDTWEPWLKKKEGFLGRQLLWDPKKEEATLLISWDSRDNWKKISEAEINKIQLIFENRAKEETGRFSENPFPIKFQGELLPQ
tara:strand:+ start:311 stop:766 length:456 start_codon:yes stop_codon:yes gene_type:complete